MKSLIMAAETIQIRVNQLQILPQNQVRLRDDDDREGLHQSLKLNGYLGGIYVVAPAAKKRDDSTVYPVHAGFGRAEWLVANEQPNKIIDVTAIEPSRAAFSALAENLGRTDLHWVDVANRIRENSKNTSENKRTQAAMCGMSEQYYGQMANIAKAPWFDEAVKMRINGEPLPGFAIARELKKATLEDFLANCGEDEEDGQDEDGDDAGEGEGEQTSGGESGSSASAGRKAYAPAAIHSLLPAAAAFLRSRVPHSRDADFADGFMAAVLFIAKESKELPKGMEWTPPTRGRKADAPSAPPASPAPEAPAPSN